MMEILCWIIFFPTMVCYMVWERLYTRIYGRKPGDFDTIFPGIICFLLGIGVDACIILFIFYR